MSRSGTTFTGELRTTSSGGQGVSRLKGRCSTTLSQKEKTTRTSLMCPYGMADGSYRRWFAPECTSDNIAQSNALMDRLSSVEVGLSLVRSLFRVTSSHSNQGPERCGRHYFRYYRYNSSVYTAEQSRSSTDGEDSVDTTMVA